MSGGEITGNTASSSYKNTSSYGGGVYVGYDGTFTMSGGEITGNTASFSSFSSFSSSSGGGVYVGGGTFTKSGGGTITGYASDTVNGNVVKKDDVVQNDLGHAVYVDGIVKRRETTAGPEVNLNPRVSGTVGGWEN
jgi:hypothetical protein